MIPANPVARTASWIALAISSIVFVGYSAILIVNLPPFMRSDHVTANWNMLFIAGFGVVGSAVTLTAVAFLLIRKPIGGTPVAIIGVEAGIIFILCCHLLYQSFIFFEVV